MRTIMIGALVLVVSQGVLAESRAPLDVKVLETSVICEEPGRHVGWPTICRRQDGELLVVFSGDRDQHICPWGKVQMIRSKDDGRTWTKPETIQSGVIDDRDAGLIELKDGTLLLNWFTSVAFYQQSSCAWEAKIHPEKRDAYVSYARHYQKLPQKLVREALGYWTARSTDGGRTWSEPSRMSGTLPHGTTELKDGRLLAVTRRFATEGQFLKSEPGFDKIGHHILCEESTDGGRSWHVLAELAAGEGVKVTDLHEPHLVELPDGRLVTQVRWHGNPDPKAYKMGIVQAESTDGGKTWTKMMPTKMIGHPPHLLVLADGRLVTVYAKRFAGAMGEYACLSEDGGRTWDVEHEICLVKSVHEDCGYPSSVQLADGTIQTVYYQSPTNGALPAVMMTHWQITASVPQPEVLTEFVKSDENPRNSEGDVVKLNDGRLLAVYTHFYKDAASPKSDGTQDDSSAEIVLTESADGGKTWSPRRTVVRKPEGTLNVMSASFLRLGDGRLALFYMVKRSMRDLRPVMIVSSDEGKTWSAPTFCVSEADIGYYVLNNARAVRLASGRILLPLAKHHPFFCNGRDWITEEAEMTCALSDDDGKSWRLSADRRKGKPPTGEKRLCLQEPGLVEMKDGRLMMYARSDRRRQYKLFSTDGGDHWTEPEPIEEYATTCFSPVTYARLESGDLVLAFNDAAVHPADEKPRAYERRWPLVLAVSSDEGRTWRKKTLERDNPQKNLHCCYIAIREIDGRLVMMYCQREALCTTRVMSVPLEWLP